MESKGNTNKAGWVGATFPRIVKLQVAIAIVAIIITILFSLRIPTLIQTKSALEADIIRLQQQKTELEKEKAELEKRATSLTSAYKQLANTFGSSVENTKMAREAVEATVNSNPDLATSLPRIFIHVRAKSQRDKAKGIAAKLQEQGYIVPGIQILVDKGPSNTQVRYFGANDGKEASKIADLLKSLGVKDANAVPITGYEKSTEVKPRQYEIWFGVSSL